MCLQLKGPCRGDNVCELLALCLINVTMLLLLSLEIVFQDRDTSLLEFSQTLLLTSFLWVSDMAATNRFGYLPLFSFALLFILLFPSFSLTPFLFTLCPLSMPLLSRLAVSLLQHYFILLFLRKRLSRRLFSRLVSEHGNGIGRRPTAAVSAPHCPGEGG